MAQCRKSRQNGLAKRNKSKSSKIRVSLGRKLTKNDEKREIDISELYCNFRDFYWNYWLLFV